MELCDPVKRSLYDMVNGFKTRDDGQLKAMAILKMEEARRSVELMQVTVMSKRAQEMVKGGLVVQSAFYGAVPEYLSMEDTIDAQATGEVVDVSVPIQCLVEESQLHMEGGESKVWEVGFYDPDFSSASTLGINETTEHRLAVRYYFKGVLHQAIVGDLQELRAPMRAHLPSHQPSPDDIAFGSDAQEALLQEEEILRSTAATSGSVARRLLRVAGRGLVLAGLISGGVWAYRRHQEGTLGESLRVLVTSGVERAQDLKGKLADLRTRASSSMMSAGGSTEDGGDSTATRCAPVAAVTVAAVAVAATTPLERIVLNMDNLSYENQQVSEKGRVRWGTVFSSKSVVATVYGW